MPEPDTAERAAQANAARLTLHRASRHVLRLIELASLTGDLPVLG